VPRLAVVPHLDTFGRGWLPSVLPAAPELRAVVVGVDERSAAVWSGGAWHATGPGAVSTFTPEGDERRWASGSVVEGLPLPGPAAGGGP
jgi:hypothetical protein